MKWFLKKIWRIRIILFLYFYMITHSFPAYVVFDAPSGYGKTFFIKKLCEIEPNEIKVMTSEAFMDNFFFTISKGYNYSENWDYTMEINNGVKILVVEDIDIFLSGRKASQEEVARMLLSVIESGISVVVTGIQFERKIPYFYRKMQSINNKTKRKFYAK